MLVEKHWVGGVRVLGKSKLEKRKLREWRYIQISFLYRVYCLVPAGPTYMCHLRPLKRKKALKCKPHIVGAYPDRICLIF